MFLNGFRVFPYGETGNDWLDIDRRKAQGYNRYIGTRDLIGYVSIEDNESSFIPVSAREGVVKNEAFEQLQSPYDINGLGKPGFVSKAFRRLEKFVVEGLNNTFDFFYGADDVVDSKKLLDILVKAFDLLKFIYYYSINVSIWFPSIPTIQLS